MNPRLTLTALALSMASCLAAPLALSQMGPGPQPGPGNPGGPDRYFIDGQLIRAIDMKASLLIEQGRPEQAIDELKKILSIETPREHPVYEAKAHGVGKLAITLSYVGRKKEALETLQRLLAEVPPGTIAEMNAYLDAGTVYKQCQMPDEALKAFDKAIELTEKLAKTAPRGPAGRPMNPPHGGPNPGRPNPPPPGS